MFKLTISFRNTEGSVETDSKVRDNMSQIMVELNTYYKDFEFNQFWEIVGFQVEELE